jgi:TolA-binding protein
MDAFASGDFGRAETLLAAFEQHHPADSRVEDAAYLRIVARARRGDAAGARQLAREYLTKYPSGFRRREAEGLAAEPPAKSP